MAIQWKMIKPSVDEVKNLGLNNSTINFLIEVGLPHNAAPFIGFEKPQKLRELYDFLDTTFNKYISIGSCDGDPIVIHIKKNDNIYLLNHEFNFEPIYINSSINKLYDSLVVFEKFTKTVLDDSPKDSFVFDVFTDEHYNWLNLELEKIEPMEENSFWAFQLKELLVNRP